MPNGTSGGAGSEILHGSVLSMTQSARPLSPCTGSLETQSKLLAGEVEIQVGSEILNPWRYHCRMPFTVRHSL